MWTPLQQDKNINTLFLSLPTYFYPSKVRGSQGCAGLTTLLKCQNKPTETMSIQEINCSRSKTNFQKEMQNENQSKNNNLEKIVRLCRVSHCH